MKLVAAALLLVACGHHSDHAVAKDDAKKILIDRNWVDRWPTTKTEKLHVYRFVPNMGGGVFQDRTVFKGTFELFRFDVDGDAIDFDLPETDQHVHSKFHIEKVDGPKPFDLKLVVENDPRGPHEYYGILAEHDPDGAALEAKLKLLR
ncbi:MAG: hypothetical protein QM831_19685 [Kofleriaceae bacterium]